jgi:GST-like protein
MWLMGSAPYLGGGFGHFYAYAPFKIEYAIDRYAMEVKRQLDVLDRRLARASTWAAPIHHRRHGDLAWYGAMAKGRSMRAASSCRCRTTRT